MRAGGPGSARWARIEVGVSCRGAAHFDGPVPDGDAHCAADRPGHGRGHAHGRLPGPARLHRLYRIPASASSPAGPSGPATVSLPEASWSRSYASRTSGCQVSAEVSSAPALVVSGGDDRALSEHWSVSLARTYPDYRQTGQEELTATNRSGPYVGIATSFSASISGSRVAGRTFVRVWSADGAALSVTQVCQQGAFDEAAWVAFLRGVAVGGLSGQSRWPTRVPGSETPAASATG